MKQGTISVIIPVYNVAAYLPECLESVLDQDYEDLEVLLVDDGSTDGSGAICDAFAARDSRIQVVHQKNAGAAAAKNTALRRAAGEYLSFVDSDDILLPNVYGHMVKLLRETGALAAQFSFWEWYRDRQEEHLLTEHRQILDTRAYLARFPKDWRCALLWNKLYRREIFENVFFEEGHKIDDEYFTYRGFLREGTVVLDGMYIYSYRKRSSSVMASPQAAKQRLLDCVDVTRKRRQIISEVFPELKRNFDENLLDTLWYLSIGEGNTEQTLALLKQQLKAYFREKGNALPPRYLWPGLMKLALLPEKTLLKKCRKEDPGSLDAYFP